MKAHPCLGPDGTTIVGHMIFCPACECGHVFNNDKHPDAARAQWSFNGNTERPTFSPSMLSYLPRGHTYPEMWRKIPHLGKREEDCGPYQGAVLWDTELRNGSRTGVRIPLELIGGDAECEFTIEAIAAKMGVDPTWTAIDERIRLWREEKFPPYRCHSFVTDGQIRFLADCTHPLAGKTVPLEDF